jgi:hypothetical protein
MQESLINPQAVDAAVLAIFGSYEKFILNLIQRRKELEVEKLKLTDGLNRIKREEGMVKKVLTGFHGKKINGLYYDSDKNELVNHKPKAQANPDKRGAINALGELLSFNKGVYNEKEEVVNHKLFHSKLKAPGSHSIQNRAAADYKHEVLSFIEDNYLPDFNKSELNAQLIDNQKIKNSFDNGLSSRQFAESLAKDFKLKSIHKQSIKIK